MCSSEVQSDGLSAPKHTSVLLKEVLEYLDPRPGQVIVDGTVGAGGHSEAIVQRLLPTGVLIAVDRDRGALALARERLAEFDSAVRWVHSDFAAIPGIIQAQGYEQVDALLLDVGVSSMQLDEADRGFSFLKDGPLDMRMDQSQGLSAAEIVNTWSEPDLEALFRNFGEERFTRSIVRSIARRRGEQPFERTQDLADVIRGAVPPKARFGRLHPATRVFQALRIAVNGELEQLDAFLGSAAGCVKPGGRIAVITFHSLEDRRVKQAFRTGEQAGIYRRLTKKPIVPSDSETEVNKRARSAKLRVVQREG